MKLIPLSIAMSSILLSGIAAAQTASLATINVGDNPMHIAAGDLKMHDVIDANKLESITRNVVALTPLDDEHEAKIEFRVKKTLQADCNARNLLASYTEKTIEGWGYNYHLVDVKGIQSTMMYCSEEPAIQDLYSINPTLINYNSKLPLVIYTPNDVELEVRVWTPSKIYK